ncbi:MAG: carbohydrate ABC transporter permease [Lachnospiraceae bacterium]|nr:carbohydrate ABC transporter permease [Lachnospiraceae bacterium]
MSANTESLQSKKLADVLSSKLKLRMQLFARKYFTGSGVKQLLVQIVMYLLVFGLAFVFIYPFLYMIVNSLMSNADLNSNSVRWLPTELKFENYAIALQLMNGKIFAKNSLMVTIIACIGHVFSCSFIGYGFARFNFPGKNLLFMFVILAFIVPTQTLIIPSYLTYSNLKWLDTYLPLTVPAFFGFGLRGALYIFLFRQFFLTVPRSLEEAARIDGCGFMRTYWKIVFPLARATIVVALVLAVVWHWNDAYEPNIYIQSPTKQFLPPRIRLIIDATNALPDQQQEMLRQLGLEDGEDTLNNAVVMAGATIISAPVLLFFAFAQRQFMQGIERSGITGE